MATQDFLFYALGIGFLVLVGFLSYASYWLAQSLKALTRTVQNAESITSDIFALRNWLEFSFLKLISTFINVLHKKRI